MPTERAIDRTRLRNQLRKLGDEYVYYILDELLEVVPDVELARVVGQYTELGPLLAEVPRAGKPSLLDAVRSFDADARSGKYFEAFAVNSRNCTQTSMGTRAFTAECRRLFDRVVRDAPFSEAAIIADSIAILLALLRTVDDGEEIVFFADEAGSWQLGIDWEGVLPVWFRCQAATAAPGDFGRAVVAAVDAHQRHNRDRWFATAGAAGSDAQREGLIAAIADTSRRR